jgi:serine/threonine-protein kinase
MIRPEPLRTAALTDPDATGRVPPLATPTPEPPGEEGSRGLERMPAYADSYVTGTGAGPDPALADLAEEVTRRLQAGEAFDPDDYEARHPQWAGQIRRLLPILEEMAELARSVAGGFGVGHLGGLGGERVVGDFRIAREVGRGGMGIVYEAEQLSLGRRVALKVLPLAAAMDPRALQRFQLEAQATAWLQHPHIVPVYAVGALGEVPFYAMQFIEGASLAELIAEVRRFEGRHAGATPDPGRAGALSSLARGLLSGRFEAPSADGPASRPDEAEAPPAPAAEAHADDRAPAPAGHPAPRGREYARAVAHLGVQAAEALEFAHAQGILHRDVKPANLLLDRRGVLWVTDFGLARLPGDGGVTLTGDVLGTLRYMSPEQALARRGLIDRRTDIYSLGATLYELLTLHPAVAGADRQDILRKMIEEEPVPVRRLNPSVPVDLATVVTKAICKDPERRYDSAQHFADDLRRFLDGRPIAARRTGPVRKAWRWCRRRPLPAGLAAALVVALVSGFVGVTLSWREAVRKRDQLAVAQKESLAALARESRANLALTTANAQESAARKLAQRRFDLAREAVEQYYTGASQEVLLRQPQMRGLRKRLLGTALAFYQRLQATSEGGPDDPKTQAELAAVYGRVGRIAVEIGSRQDGLEALERARAILERLVALDPRAAGPRRDLASCVEFIGRLQVYTSGREADGRRSLERALALYESLAAEHPRSADDLFAVANVSGEIGYERGRSGQTAEGLRSLDRERQILDGLVRDHPDRALYRNQLALTYGQIGRIEANAGRTDEALDAHREASAHFERLMAEGSTDGLVRRRLGQAETDTARILTDAGRPEEAVPHLERALAILEPLAAESPAVASYQRAVAECYDVLGAGHARAGRHGDALRALGRARAPLEQLVADHPNFIAYQADLAENQLWTGFVYRRSGKTTGALGELRRASELLARLPAGSDSAYALARVEAEIAALADPGGRGPQSERAAAALRRAVRLGYHAADALRADPCLDALRARPEFEGLVLDAQFPADPFQR